MNRLAWSADVARFRAVLDCLIPPNPDKGIPGAGALGVFAFVAERVRADERTALLFDRGSNRLDEIAAGAGHAFEALSEEQRVDVLRELERTEPVFFAALIRLTYMGYYSRPDIRVLLGLSGEPAHPGGYDMTAESPELLAELTAPVRSRGPVYRDV